MSSQQSPEGQRGAFPPLMGSHSKVQTWWAMPQLHLSVLQWDQNVGSCSLSLAATGFWSPHSTELPTVQDKQSLTTDRSHLQEEEGEPECHGGQLPLIYVTLPLSTSGLGTRDSGWVIWHLGDQRSGLWKQFWECLLMRQLRALLSSWVTPKLQACLVCVLGLLISPQKRKVRSLSDGPGPHF